MNKVYRWVESVLKVRPINKSLSPDLDKDTSVTPKDKVTQNSKGALYLNFYKLRSTKQSWEGLIPQ